VGTAPDDKSFFTLMQHRMHHCSARLISVPIREWFEHETVWESAVHIFDLEGHPTASRSLCLVVIDRGKR
jgi:hypothetical protein